MKIVEFKNIIGYIFCSVAGLGMIMGKRVEYKTIDNVRFVFRNVVKWQKSLVPISILKIIIGAVEVFALPMLVKLLIDSIDSKANMTLLLKYVILFFAIILIEYLIRGYCENRIKWKIDYCNKNFMKLILKASLNMDFEFLESPKVLNCYQKSMNAVRTANRGTDGLMNSMINVSETALKIVAAATIISTLNPLFLIVMIFLAVIQFVPTDKANRKAKEEVWDALIPYWRRYFDLNRVSQSYENGKDIRMFSMAEWIHKKHLSVNDEMQNIMVHCKNIWIKCHIFLTVLGTIQEIVLYAWLVFCVLYRGLSLGNFTLYVSAVRNLSKELSAFLTQFAGMRIQSAEINDYREFLTFDKEERRGLPLKKEKIVTDGKYKFEIRFDNVSFRYEGQQKWAIRNLNLSIKAGERLAVVGLNGAGKTTMCKLLCRLYEPTEGRILLNGVDIREYDRKDYYKIFSAIFQNVEIYACSVAENVSMLSIEEIDRDLVRKCLERVGLKKKICSFSKEIDTQLLKIMQSDGVDMSGGERQKVAMARALYKDAPIIMLDEPTAALDPIAEYKQYSDFDEITKDKTVIYISHRLSSTQFCDNILMLEGGRVIEYGNHSDLLKRGGPYSELFRVQAQYYKLEEDAISG